MKQYNPNEPTECPICEAINVESMGILGNLIHFRCQACGTDYNLKISAENAVLKEKLEEKIGKNKALND